MRKLKKSFLFSLILLPVAVVGGYFAALMSIASIEPSILESVIKQFGSKQLLVVVSTIQPVILALISGFFGYILSEKVGLMRPFGFERSKLLKTILVSLTGGALFSLDAWTFARWIPGLRYDASSSFDAVTWIASILYGGIIEEVMLRLFFMSLLSFLAWKLFFRKEETVPTGVFIIANIIAAVIFAAGHLPATALAFGALTPMLLFRCFLLNGTFGLIFGRLYRKYGIQYAMLAHMLFHIVSKTIWMIAL